MKKRLTTAILLLTLALTVWASARYTNFTRVNPHVSFRGNTANCLMEIEADDGVNFNATMTLYRVENGKETFVKEWGTSGTTSLEFEGSYPGAVSGKTYKLTVKVTALGETATESTTATCP